MWLLVPMVLKRNFQHNLDILFDLLFESQRDHVLYVQQPVLLNAIHVRGMSFHLIPIMPYDHTFYPPNISDYWL